MPDNDATAQPLPPPFNSLDPDTLLTREATARKSTECGADMSPATLATLAVRGGGPRYHRFGKSVRYRWRDYVSWVLGRLGEAASSTSEHARKRRVAHERADLRDGVA